MARVPTAQPSVNIESARPTYQQVDSSAAAFGANSAAALGKLGNSLVRTAGIVSDINTDQKKQDNIRQAKQLDTQFSNALRELQYGDGTDQNPGYYNLQGQNAVDAYPAYTQKVNDLRNTILGQATTNQSYQLFNDASAERSASALDTMGAHVTKQRQQADLDASNARIDTAKGNMIVGAADPATFQQSVDVFKSEITSQALKNGDSPDVARAKYDKLYSESVAGGVANLALTDPAAAEKLLAAHRGELTGVAASQAQASIIEAQTRIRVQQEHNLIMQEKQQELNSQAAMHSYVQDIWAKSQAGQPIDLASMASDPTLKYNQVENLISFTQTLSDQARTNNAIKTDPQVFKTLWTLSHLPDGDPNKINNPDDIAHFVGKGLTVPDYLQIANEINTDKSPEGKVEGELKNQLMKVAVQALDKSNTLTGISDPKGGEQLLKWQSWFLPEYLKQRQAGMTAQQLLDPSSKDYMGTTIAQYQRTPQQIFDDLGAANPGNTALLPPVSSTQVKVGADGSMDKDSQAIYDKLKPGDHFIVVGPDGKGIERTKGGTAAPAGQ